MELEEVAEPDPLIDCSDISEAEVATALRRMKTTKLLVSATSQLSC